MKVKLIGGLRHGTVVDIPDDLPPYFEMPWWNPTEGPWMVDRPPRFASMMIERYRRWDIPRKTIDGTWQVFHCYADADWREAEVRGELMLRNEGGY
jgi:hypothetical protein